MKIFLSIILKGFTGTIILLLLPVILFAQGFSFKLYSVSDGLTGTSVHIPFQDSNGYLWVGTTSGLSRFDGKQFVNFSLEDGLPSLNIGKIFQDSKGRLWIGTSTGAAQFKKNRFVTYPFNDDFQNPYVFGFTETKDKRLWVLTSRGVYEFKDHFWEKIFLCKGYENTACRNVVEKDGELFVCYPHDIVCRNKDGIWLHIATSKPNSLSIFNVLGIHENRLFVSTINNIFEIRDHKLFPLFRKNLPTKNYFSFLFDSRERLWLTGKEFIKISWPFDWQHFYYYLHQNDQYAFIQEDSNHNFWSSTIKGLLKLRDISYSIIKKNKKTTLDGIYNIIPLPGNRFLFSSGTKYGLLMYDHSCCKAILPEEKKNSRDYYRDPVDGYTSDSLQNIWMITRFRKLYQFNGKRLEDHSRILHLKTSELIFAIEYVKSRKQFFLCADSTLLFGNSTKLSTFIPANTGVPVVKPTRVHELKNGLVLLYINKEGLFIIDHKNNLLPIHDVANSLSVNKMFQVGASICETSGNTFWVGIAGLGIFEYAFTQNQSPFLINHYSVKDGLQSNNILSLAEDKKGRIWVATSTGLDILQLNKMSHWEIFNYAKVEDLGVVISDFTKLVKDTSGNIWLSSPNEILQFNTNNVILEKKPPNIIIEKVEMNFKETDWSKIDDSLYTYFQLPFNLHLNYNQNSLAIFFNAVDLSATNSNPEYSHKLIPLDTSWSVPSKTKSVSFAQLPAGKYQFLVRARDMASGWSQPAIFRFTITPPFWDRWWFRLLIIGMASFLIISIFTSRVRKIRKDAFIENQLKELEMKALKAQMNPHFIYNALNSIQALVANDKKEEGIRYIGSFSRLLRQVLDNSENNVISLDKELESIDLYIQLEALRLNMELKYKKIIPENIVAEYEKIPPLILQPFVENALWHGLSYKEGEKEIIISISTSNDWLICEIKDNGIGRIKAASYKTNSSLNHQSKALGITQKRLLDFNNDNEVIPVEFEDLYDITNQPAGTKVTVLIKRKFQVM